MKTAALALSVVAISACSPIGQQDTERNVHALQAQALALREDLTAQRELSNSLETRLQALESAPSRLQRQAYLDPAGDSGYQVLQTNVLPLLVSFSDAAAVGDGTKVILRIGNTSSATISGVTLKIQYNSRVPEDPKILEQWNSKLRTVTATSVTQLDAGAWSLVEASLPAIKPNELGYIRVEAEMSSLLLRKPL